MPTIIAGFVVGEFIAGTAISFAATSTLISLVGAGISFAITSLFKPKAPDLGSGLNTSSGSPLTDEVNKRMQVVRSSTQPKIIVYGNCVVGGLLTYINSADLFNFGQKQFVYMVTTIAPHRLGAINEVIWEETDLSDIDEDYYESPTDGTGKLWRDGFEIHFLTTNKESTGSGIGLETRYNLDGTDYDWMPVWQVDGWGTTLASVATNNGMGLALYLSDRVRSYEFEAIKSTDVAFPDNALNFSRMMFLWNLDQANIALVPISSLISDDALERTGISNRDIYFPRWNITTNQFDTLLVPDFDGGSPTQYRVYRDDDDVTQYWLLADTNIGHTSVVSVANVKVDASGNYCVWDWNGSSYDTDCTAYNPTIPQQGVASSPIDRFSNIEFRIDGGQAYSPDLIAKEAILQMTPYTGEQLTIDSELSGLFPEWDSVGYEQSYAKTRWFYDYERLPNGIPNMRFNVSGKPIYNPMTSEVVPSNNAALVILDYLRNPLGFGASDDEIDFDSFTNQINICDRIIDTSIAKSFTFDKFFKRYYTGNMPELVVTSHGFSDSGICKVLMADGNFEYNVRYNVIDKNHIRLERRLSETLLSSGFITSQEKQYTIDGTASTVSKSTDVIDSMLVNIGYGKIRFNNGKFNILAGTNYVIEGTYPNRTFKHEIDDTTFTVSNTLIEIDESFLAGDVSVSPFAARNDLFNAVKGTYAGNRQSNFQVTEFIAIKNSSYCQIDNAGVACQTDQDFIYKHIEYPYVTQNFKAQRYAKILLEKSRHATTVRLFCNFKVYVLDVGDICTLSLENLGYDKMEFEVADWEWNPLGGINLVLQSTSQNIYDWDPSDASAKTLPDVTIVENLSWTLDLVNITVIPRAVFTTEGKVKEKAFISVESDAGYQFYKDTEVQYRKVITTDTEWQIANKGDNELFVIEDLELARYVVRARRHSSTSAPTQWLYEDFTAQGAGSWITEVVMPKPLNPIGNWSIINDKIGTMRISVDIDETQWQGDVPQPEYLAIMYAMEESKNEVGIVDDTLVAEGTEILAQAEQQVIADVNNSVNVIRIWQTQQDTSIDLAGMWWIQVRRIGGSKSIAVKVDRYDGLYIYLARDLSFVPIDTDVVEIYEVAFHDMRTDEFKLGCIADENNNYEVIKWEDLQFDSGQFQFQGVTREVEDSTLLDATGTTFSYYPAPGYGTKIVLAPASSFSNVDEDTLQSNITVDINIPDGWDWSSVTCMFGTNVMKDGLPVIYRSPIVLLNYGGES